MSRRSSASERDGRARDQQEPSTGAALHAGPLLAQFVLMPWNVPLLAVHLDSVSDSHELRPARRTR